MFHLFFKNNNSKTFYVLYLSAIASYCLITISSKYSQHTVRIHQMIWNKTDEEKNVLKNIVAINGEEKSRLINNTYNKMT